VVLIAGQQRQAGGARVPVWALDGAFFGCFLGLRFALLYF
jgi:hypothetical protein